jgi:hypothetical protein
MADLFAFSPTDWLFPSSNTEDGDKTGRHENHLESNGPADTPVIFNAFHTGLPYSLVPSNINHNLHPSHLSATTNLTDQFVGEPIQDNIEMSSYTSPNSNLAFVWCEEGRNISQNTSSIMTRHAGCNLE